MTLRDIVARFGDGSKEITYLKVDIEGAELKALRQWIDSGNGLTFHFNTKHSKEFTEAGVLANVRQIGMELHTGIHDIPFEDIIPGNWREILHSVLSFPYSYLLLSRRFHPSDRGSAVPPRPGLQPDLPRREPVRGKGLRPVEGLLLLLRDRHVQA